MKFTDIFIERPVLSSVISLLIFILGIASYLGLPLSQFPKITSTTITVTTAYPGASADLVKSFITTPLSSAIGSAEGIDYLTSTSTSGLSAITAYIDLNYDPNAALTNISAAVNSVLNQLPAGIILPSIKKQTGDTFPVMFIAFSSETMASTQISAYLTNVVMPKLYSVSGISQLQLWGGQTFAMRIWLDPTRMADLGVTPQDVQTALQNNNVLSAAGQLQGKYDLLNIQPSTDIRNVADFNNMVIKQVSNRIIRIRDVGDAELGAQTYTTAATYNGKLATFLTVRVSPTANPLTVVDGVRALLPSIQKDYPPGLKSSVAYDATIYVRTAIKDVIKTVFEAIVIVIAVVFLFLGSPRAIIIPIIAIPLSIVGVFFLMLMMGFTINLLTLLAIVLAVGLVVDDAIVVMENIHRLIEAGMPPFKAAIIGSRQIAAPVILMTLTLTAVFTPIGFMGGVTGSLFKEFAFTLAASVIISGVVALTFSPMLTSKIITPHLLQKPLAHTIDKLFSRLQNSYQNILHQSLDFRSTILIIGGLTLVSCYFLFKMTPTELAPQEDQGALKVAGTASINASLNYMEKFGVQIDNILQNMPETASTYIIYGFPSSNIVLGGAILKPWDERSQTEMTLKGLLQQQVNKVAGLQSQVFQNPSLPGTPFGPPVNFVLLSTGSYEILFDLAQTIIQQANKSGLFLALQTPLRFNNPQIDVTIDRSKAASLGINMQAIGTALATLFGGNYVNFFNQQGYSYQVIPQVPLVAFTNKLDDLANIRISTNSGKLVPLSSMVKMSYSTQPSQLDQFQQQNSATIQGVLAPGVTLGQALDYLAQLADQVLPKGVSYDFGGASRQYVDESNALMYAFLLAVIIIFLMLAAQFESFRDPLIIMMTVPMSIFGALIPLYFGAGTINIYTQVGLITLVGLITKHGILMVEFANKLQDEKGLSKREAIEQAAAIRLRPILMTTAAMVFGVVPLILATGAGAVSRNNLGIVIGFGMTIGTLFTLFMVPTLYVYINKRTLLMRYECATKPD
ncbi:MAG TPA: efflux RND transporter permease subunit [Gammaproteobacteria bacterium]|nr:efflux RND transporter permease subunit [Gammaproteobacteria bacterium]